MARGSFIRTEVTIERPVADVYDYVTTPANWPQWHPSSIRVTGEAAQHSLQIGEQCVEEFLVAGRRGEAGWICRERIPERRWVIEAILARGGSGTITYGRRIAAESARATETLKSVLEARPSRGTFSAR
jgi:hypothetical protein